MSNPGQIVAAFNFVPAAGAPLTRGAIGVQEVLAIQPFEYAVLLTPAASDAIAAALQAGTVRFETSFLDDGPNPTGFRTMVKGDQTSFPLFPTRLALRVYTSKADGQSPSAGGDLAGFSVTVTGQP